MGNSGHETWLKLWDDPSLDPTTRVKTAMREALGGLSKSRDQVVDDMNRLAAREGITGNGNGKGVVTLDLLDKWVAHSAPNVIPMKLLPLFCRVIGSILPLKALMAAAGGTVISGEDVKLLEWARAEKKRKEISKRARKLAQEAGLE